MKKVLKVLGVLILIGAIGRAFGPMQTPADPAAVEASERARNQEAEGRARVRDAKEKMRARLRDPASAQFSEVVPVRHGDTLTVCGYVNAKNGFGGYTGRKAFLVLGNLAASEDDLEAGVFTEMWNRLCTG